MALLTSQQSKKASDELPLLKIYLCSKLGNDGMPSNSAHISLVLNHRLDQEWSITQQYVELNAVLGLPGSHARKEKI